MYELTVLTETRKQQRPCSWAAGAGAEAGPAVTRATPTATSAKVDFVVRTADNGNLAWPEGQGPGGTAVEKSLDFSAQSRVKGHLADGAGGASLDCMTAALLVAEPEAEVRGFLEHHLTSDGFDVLGTAGAGEALDLAERARPDLVLVAIELGGGAGLELCRRLREGEPGRDWDRR